MGAEAVINLLSLLLMTASIAGTWMVFVKAGHQGWKAVIPFYNYYMLLRITKHSGWWVAVLVVPTVLILFAGATITYQLVQLSAGGAQALVEMVAVIILIATPIVITINAVVMYDLARAFGKRLPFTVGLTLFPFIFLIWLGFGDETFRGVPEDSHPGSDKDSVSTLAESDSEDTKQKDSQNIDGFEDKEEVGHVDENAEEQEEWEEVNAENVDQQEEEKATNEEHGNVDSGQDETDESEEENKE